MHVAILRRKFDIARLKEADSRLPQEDLVTSMVFGTLQYLPAAAIVRFLTTALRTLRAPAEAQLALTQLAEAPDPWVRFAFWPNLAATSQDAQVSRIEPDVVIKCWRRQADQRQEPCLRILVECKWNSSLSGEEQLWRQWTALSDAQRQQTLHVYLVKDASQGWAELFPVTPPLSDAHQMWRQRAFVVTWAQLIRPEVLRLSGPVHRWLEDMHQLLIRLGIVPFDGFHAVAQEAYAPAPPILFWHRFHGFAQLGRQAVCPRRPGLLSAVERLSPARSDRSEADVRASVLGGPAFLRRRASLGVTRPEAYHRWRAASRAFSWRA